MGLVLGGVIMANMKVSEFKFSLYFWHKATGVLVLGLVALRVVWRFYNPAPPLPKEMPLWQVLASKCTHVVLYTFMLASPISGFVMSAFSGHPINFYGLFTIPPLRAKGGVESYFAHEAHWMFGYVWIALLSLHIGAALYHHYLCRDNVLRRMLPIRKVI